MPWGKGKPRYGRSGWDWQRTVRAVLERDGGRCRYCGGVATTADHVLPKARDGSDAMDNLVACCAPCNEQRRSALAVESRPSRRRQAEPHPGDVGGGRSESLAAEAPGTDRKSVV